MSSIRRADLPGLLLALLLAVAFLLPEAGHSHAHQQLAHHDSETAHAEAFANPAHDDLVFSSHHDADEHEHLSLVATPTAKPLVLAEATASPFELPRPELRWSRVVRTGFASSLPPGLLEHGPPPPSRAPPLV
jgi:hypothetical protein